MKKIVKQKINPDFMPVAVELIHVGKVIGFDCYIRRFNDYVVIIEAGTLVTPELYDHITANKSVYISLKDHAAYKTYCKNNSTIQLEEDEELLPMEDAVNECLSLSKSVAKLADAQEKMRCIYEAACKMMLTYEQSASPFLPMEAVKAYIDALLDVSVSKGTVFGCLSRFAPERYSFQTHAVNVSILAAMLGNYLKFNRSALYDLVLAALLHDVGKINISRSILEKDGPLKDDEIETVRHHPELSVDILRENKINDPKIVSSVKFHHERLDGSGYPSGLKARTIPVNAQIIGLCDVFDALTTERTFRARYSSFDALVLIKKEMAAEFSNKHVDALIRMLKRK